MRILTFADGFTSSASPTGAGSIQEAYNIENLETSELLFTLDSNIYRSMFADYELVRKTNTESFIQTGSFIIAFNGTWGITYGNFSGDDLLQTDPPMGSDVTLSIDAITGDLTYSTGFIAGVAYEGTLKLNATRIV